MKLTFAIAIYAFNLFKLCKDENTASQSLSWSMWISMWKVLATWMSFAKLNSSLIFSIFWLKTWSINPVNSQSLYQVVNHAEYQTQ